MQTIDASVDAMVANLKSERADRFDQGMRQAGALARLLQDSPSLAGGGAQSRHLVEAALSGIGRALETSIERRCDPARHHALNAAATALAQALVGDGGAHPRQPSEALQRLVVGPEGCSDVNWHGARATGTLPLLGAAGATPGSAAPSLADLATLALRAPAVDALSGQISALLQAACELAPALPRGSCRSSWTAHLLLRPQALTELLGTVLRVLCAPGARTPSPAALRAALAAHPDWAAGLAAAAAHPALLLIARATLRSWLAASGSAAAWVVHWELFRLATGGGAAPGVLYPAPLRAAAAEVHAASASTLAGDTTGPDVASALAELQRAAAGMGGAAGREEAWALSLDAPALAAAVLRQLPWATMQAEGDEEGGSDATAAGGGSGQATVEGAEWAAALAWPFQGQAEQRRETATALMEGRAVTPAARAGVAAIARWRAAWPLAQLTGG